MSNSPSLFEFRFQQRGRFLLYLFTWLLLSQCVILLARRVDGQLQPLPDVAALVAGLIVTLLVWTLRASTVLLPTSRAVGIHFWLLGLAIPLLGLITVGQPWSAVAVTYILLVVASEVAGWLVVGRVVADGGTAGQLAHQAGRSSGDELQNDELQNNELQNDEPQVASPAETPPQHSVAPELLARQAEQVAMLQEMEQQLSQLGSDDLGGDEFGADESSTDQAVTDQAGREAALLTDSPLESSELEWDEEGPLLEAGVQQQLVDRVEGDQRVIEGVLRVVLSAGEHLQDLHLSFCPPFVELPEIELHQLEGPESRLQVGDTQLFGARLQVRVLDKQSLPCELILQFSAAARRSVSAA